MTNNFSLDRSQEEKDRNVDDSNEKSDNYHILFISCNKEDSRNQNDDIFVYCQDIVPSYEYLLIVLNIFLLTWLNLSASFTENCSLSQLKLCSVSLFKELEYSLLPFITANLELTSPSRYIMPARPIVSTNSINIRFLKDDKSFY